MDSQWNEQNATALEGDFKALRVYTSQLLGRDPNLVLHGGGNTSVKLTESDPSGQDQKLLFIKGSGQDLATIDESGFTAVRIETLLRMAQCESLTDSDMVSQQRLATTNTNAPNPSVEAILHAIIPFRFVDHTHADSIIAITNTPDGIRRIKDCFSDRLLIIPYVMPGFILARTVYEMTQGIQWSQYDGMVLMNHGLFTFGDDARSSYEAMIDLVSRAEDYLRANGAHDLARAELADRNAIEVAQLRRAVADARGKPVVAIWDTSAESVGFARLKNISNIAMQGPVTPDHSIRTKRIPMLLDGDIESCIQAYGQEYQKYFDTHKAEGLTCLDPAPRWVIAPEHGLISFGATLEEANIIADIVRHTAKVVQQAEALGGWTALSPQDVFDVEYWELEQAKLNHQQAALPLQGKIALVTGGASEIGKAIVHQLSADGAVVIAADINPDIESMFASEDIVGQVCDVCDANALLKTIRNCISTFGGIDIVVSNAGILKPTSESENDARVKAAKLTLAQHKNLFQQCVPFLNYGIDPTFVLIDRQNDPPHENGASIDADSKADLDQFIRDAALELGILILVNKIPAAEKHQLKGWSINKGLI